MFVPSMYTLLIPLPLVLGLGFVQPYHPVILCNLISVAAVHSRGLAHVAGQASGTLPSCTWLPISVSLLLIGERTNEQYSPVFEVLMI